MAPEQLTDSPVIIYASIIVGVVIVVAGSVPKVLGPIGKAIYEWQERRRAQRAAEEADELATRDQQIAYLKGRVSEQDRDHAEYRRRVSAREARWRREWTVHLIWDYAVMQRLIELGADPPQDPAPDLMTPDPPFPNESKED